MKRLTLLSVLPVFASAWVMPGCGPGTGIREKAAVASSKFSIMKEPFGKADGQEVFLYTLKNSQG
ncbi:MAG TPA: hypothetical protein VMC08_07625, partial [Bacteroidales bacterium]|nr:hypothetical protein [Bacteroidales bacterium]